MHIEDGSHLPEQRKEGKLKGKGSRQDQLSSNWTFLITLHHFPTSSVLLGFALYEPMNMLPRSMASWVQLKII